MVTSIPLMGRLLTVGGICGALFPIGRRSAVNSFTAGRGFPLVSCHILEDDHILCADFKSFKGPSQVLRAIA